MFRVITVKRFVNDISRAPSLSGVDMEEDHLVGLDSLGEAQGGVLGLRGGHGKAGEAGLVEIADVVGL